MGTHHKGTPEENMALDVFIKLMRASNAVLQRATRDVTEAGLTVVHFGVLETLYHLGPMMISQLAEKHLKSRNNFTVVIDNLEKHGYVRRERDDADRRSVKVHLTQKGRDRVEPLIPVFVQAAVREMQVLSPDEQQMLSNLLRRLGRQQTA